MMAEQKTEGQIEVAGSELAEGRWSVVSFDRCEASGLTYSQAEAAMDELLSKNFYGLCIVTDEAAGRVTEN